MLTTIPLTRMVHCWWPSKTQGASRLLQAWLYLRTKGCIDIVLSSRHVLEGSSRPGMIETVYGGELVVGDWDLALRQALHTVLSHVVSPQPSQARSREAKG